VIRHNGVHNAPARSCQQQEAVREPVIRMCELRPALAGRSCEKENQDGK